MQKPGRWLSGSFLLLWQGQLVSVMGSQVFVVTLALWLIRHTGSATLMGLLLMAGSVPGVLLGPIGGALADRYSRRTVLVAGDLLRGLSLISVAVVMFWLPQSPRAGVAALFVAAVIGGTVGAVWQPAAAAVIPEMVPRERLSTANSLVQASIQICGMVAKGLGGLLFRAVGAPLLALADGFSYLYAAATEAIAIMPSPPRKATAAGGRFSVLKRQILEGLEYVRARAGLRMMLYTMTFQQFFMVPMVVLFPFYVTEHLHAGPEWYGYLLATSSVGTLAGFAFAGTVRLKGAAMSRLIVALLVFVSLSLAGLGLVSSRWAAAGIVFGIGATNGFLGVKLITILQLNTEPSFRGRVIGLIQTITGGLAPVAMGLTGIVADLTGRNLPLIYLVCGGITSLLWASTAMRRECRAFLAGEEPALPIAAAVVPRTA
ncbi:MAG TPA: MFS transporter [Vicinamibacteria bacterium]